MPRFNRLLITGAAGNLGRELRRGLAPLATTLRLTDRSAMDPAGPGEEVIEADVVEAKVIEEPSIGSLSSRHLRDSHLAEKVSLADDKMDEHIHQVFDHQVGGLASSSQSDRMPDETADDKVPENYVDALVGMLSSSTGLQQAILVREIFDRPTHRW